MGYSLYVDLDRCFGCSTCEVACKQEHDLPVGPRWIRVSQDGPKKSSTGLQLDYYPVICKHCDNPKCAEICPRKAISKGPEGIVLIDDTLCDGCKACIEACPFGLMDFDPEAEKASKCNLCSERLEKGVEPSCVILCPGKALILEKGSGILESSRIRRVV